jgi:hypothetical protein
LIDLAGSGPEGASLRALANSMDGSDGLLEPLVAGEAYQIQNKPFFLKRKNWLINVNKYEKVSRN